MEFDVSLKDLITHNRMGGLEEEKKYCRSNTSDLAGLKPTSTLLVCIMQHNILFADKSHH